MAIIVASSENLVTTRGSLKKAAPFFLLRPRAVFRFLTSSKAPLLPKLGIAAAIAYIVLPIDAVPDLLPVIGWLDDVGAVTLAVAWLGREIAKFEEQKEELKAPSA